MMATEPTQAAMRAATEWLKPGSSTFINQYDDLNPMAVAITAEKIMDDLNWFDRLKRLDPCPEAVAWAKTYATLAEAWSACQRGDWMLWLAERLAGPPMSDSRRPLVLAACECARLALSHTLTDVSRSLTAIGLAERWARGDDAVTIDDLKATWASAGAWAAWAAVGTAVGVGAAAEAAEAAEAVWAAGAVAARAAALSQCADIVRKHYPRPPELP